MFEIIMLFAFLLAATSQLLPEKRTGNRQTANEKEQGPKKQRESLQHAGKRSVKKRGEAKRRNRNYACAA